MFNMDPKDLDLNEVTKVLPSSLKNLRTELRNDGVLEIQMPSNESVKNMTPNQVIEKRNKDKLKQDKQKHMKMIDFEWN